MESIEAVYGDRHHPRSKTVNHGRDASRSALGGFIQSQELTRVRLQAGRGKQLCPARGAADPGSIGYEGPTFDERGCGDTRFFSLGPSITWAALVSY